jgi:hypothetical protein
VLASPRLGADQSGGALAHLVGGHQLAGREDQRLGEILGRALVVDAEAGEPVDLVTPQVDADRRVGRRGEDVDDRAAPGELAAVLDELLAAVSEADELGREVVGVDDRTGMHAHRLDLGGSRSEPLQQRPHARDDHGRRRLGLAQAPEHLEALAHRLDRGAHPLERQRLPRRELDDLAVGQELGEVVGELPGHGPRRRRDDERAAVRQVRQRGDGDRAGDLDDGQAGVGLSEGAGQPRLITQQGGERSQSHGPSEGTATPAPPVADRVPSRPPRPITIPPNAF